MGTGWFFCCVDYCDRIPLFRVSGQLHTHSLTTHAHTHTNLWPISWATVKATGRPESSLMLQLRWGWHIPDRWDRPRVSQGWLLPAQMSFLGEKIWPITKILHTSTKNRGSINRACNVSILLKSFNGHQTNKMPRVSLTWWWAQPHHDELGVCHSGGSGFSARRRNWTKWSLHGELSLTLSVTNNQKQYPVITREGFLSIQFPCKQHQRVFFREATLQKLELSKCLFLIFTQRHLISRFWIRKIMPELFVKYMQMFS